MKDESARASIEFMLSDISVGEISAKYIPDTEQISEVKRLVSQE